MNDFFNNRFVFGVYETWSSYKRRGRFSNNNVSYKHRSREIQKEHSGFQKKKRLNSNISVGRSVRVWNRYDVSRAAVRAGGAEAQQLDDTAY